MIKLDDYITSSGKYPERANSPELTKAAILYATELLERVNKALKHLNFTDVKVSSGFRPSKVNGSVGGSKMSAHMTCQAIDLVDVDGTLAVLFLKNKKFFKDWGLYIEDPRWTKGWLHCQTRPTKSNPFIPNSSKATDPDFYTRNKLK